MKKLHILLAIVLFTAFSFAQDNKKDDWIRVQSDDGEFSIEVPAKYGYFYNKYDNAYSLDEMSVLNAYTEHTLLSFESYKRPFNMLSTITRIKNIKNVDDVILREQQFYPHTSEIKKDGYKIEQLVYVKDNLYTVRQYFYTQNFLYVITASSRMGETLAIKRFLESVIVKPVAKSNSISNKTRFPDLKATPIEFEEDTEKKQKKDTKVLTQPDTSVKPLLIISKPTAFTLATEVKQNHSIQLKVDFSEIGQITKIVILKKLKPGFRSDLILAVLRMKYLPEEKDDQPIAVTKTIDYDVSGY